MNEMIKKLYNGDVYPAEQIVPTDPEYPLIHKQIDDKRAYLIEAVSFEITSYLEELERLYLASSSMEKHAGFVCGFHLGVQLMHEALAEDVKKASVKE